MAWKLTACDPAEMLLVHGTESRLDRTLPRRMGAGAGGICSGTP